MHRAVADLRFDRQIEIAAQAADASGLTRLGVGDTPFSTRIPAMRVRGVGEGRAGL